MPDKLTQLSVGYASGCRPKGIRWPNCGPRCTVCPAHCPLWRVRSCNSDQDLLECAVRCARCSNWRDSICLQENGSRFAGVCTSACSFVHRCVLRRTLKLCDCALCDCLALQLVFDAMRVSSGNSFCWETEVPRMLKGDYYPVSSSQTTCQLTGSLADSCVSGWLVG